MKAGGGLPEDEWSADVGGECLANKHFTCMDACARIRTPTYTPPTQPPNTHTHGLGSRPAVLGQGRSSRDWMPAHPECVCERHHSWPEVHACRLTAFTMRRQPCQSKRNTLPETFPHFSFNHWGVGECTALRTGAVNRKLDKQGLYAGNISIKATSLCFLILACLVLSVHCCCELAVINQAMWLVLLKCLYVALFSFQPYCTARKLILDRSTKPWIQLALNIQKYSMSTGFFFSEYIFNICSCQLQYGKAQYR